MQFSTREQRDIFYDAVIWVCKLEVEGTAENQKEFVRWLTRDPQHLAIYRYVVRDVMITGKHFKEAAD